MSEVGMNTGPSNVNFSSLAVIRTWCASFLQGQILQTMLQYVILAPCGTFFLRMKNQVLVHLMFPMNWRRRPILLDIPFLHFFYRGFSWGGVNHVVFPCCGKWSHSLYLVRGLVYLLIGKSLSSYLHLGARLVLDFWGWELVAWWFLGGCPWYPWLGSGGLLCYICALVEHVGSPLYCSVCIVTWAMCHLGSCGALVRV